MNSYLWNRILWYISKRERCEKEVQDYLKRISKFSAKGGSASGEKAQISKEESEEIIEKLIKLDFLNEDRFTRAYVHDSYQLKNKGKNRIKQELKNRRIDELTIEKYLNEIESSDEEDKARDFAKKRHELIKNLPQETQKRRLFGSLVRRGYQPHLAFKIIDEILKIR
jgi:regulatory protein